LLENISLDTRTPRNHTVEPPFPPANLKTDLQSWRAPRTNVKREKNTKLPGTKSQERNPRRSSTGREHMPIHSQITN
jgi:hypothetical protein